MTQNEAALRVRSLRNGSIHAGIDKYHARRWLCRAPLEDATAAARDDGLDHAPNPGEGTPLASRVDMGKPLAPWSLLRGTIPGVSRTRNTPGNANTVDSTAMNSAKPLEATNPVSTASKSDASTCARGAKRCLTETVGATRTCRRRSHEVATMPEIPSVAPPAMLGTACRARPDDVAPRFRQQPPRHHTHEENESTGARKNTAGPNATAKQATAPTRMDTSTSRNKAMTGKSWVRRMIQPPLAPRL